MGHLVNSIGTRLGWFAAWKDEIYLRTAENSDYVHHFIRIRLALIFVLFSREPWDEYCFIFSHFHMLKKRRTICVIIHVYTGKVMLFHEGFRQYFVFYAKRLSNVLPRYFRGSFIHNLLVIRGLMLTIDPFGFKDYRKKVKKAGKFMNSNKKRKNYMKLAWGFLNTKRHAVDNFYGVRSFKASVLLNNNTGVVRNKVNLLRNLGLRWRLLNVAAYWRSFRILTEALFTSSIYATLYSFMCEYFEYLISQVLFCEKSHIAVIFEFFLNDYVTPTFVTRYMLRKLAQNFTWRYTIDTMVREFALIMRKVIDKPVQSTLLKNKERNLINLSLYTFNYTKTFLTMYLSMYKDKYQIDNNSIKIFFRYAYTGLILMNLLVECKNVIYSVGSYIRKYSGQQCLDVIFKIILDDFIYTFMILKYNNTIQQINVLDSIKTMVYAYFAVKFRFLRHNVKKSIFGFKNTSWTNRFKKNFNNKFMEGFKFRMGGRLSRKQRASSFILTVGTVPLNTYSCNIEHAFFSAPLRNSELTIKLWFNKNTEPVAFQNYRRYNSAIFGEPLDDEEEFPDEDDE